MLPVQFTCYSLSMSALTSSLMTSEPSQETNPPAKKLQDSFGRRFAYLRLSVTDACNFRCKYCLPNGYKAVTQEEPLTLSEMTRLVEAFAGMGTVKLRLTGGEPTLRRDFIEIVNTLAAVSGIEQVAISTNGWNLKQIAKKLQLAGVSKVNVSLDSLEPKNFAEMTGTDQLGHVLDGIEECLALGYNAVKINAVLMANTNAKELDRFLEYVRLRPVSVRFIELMRTSENGALFTQEHVSADFITRQLSERGWQICERGAVDGPAVRVSPRGLPRPYWNYCPVRQKFLCHL